ncbi:MAG: phospho-N-acetylmuramoyl-pentapeptide-transferase [Bacteroidetes bacterium]|nr:MAG: phospho-N-acetylmuramoyl-pentapeptide-transferase [Bacteroidota bacterium]
MLYYLFGYLHKNFDLPGSGVFQYISFRASLAIICSLLISMVFGKRIIEMLRKKQVGETIRNLGLAGEKQKQGTPTMGGLIIISAILVPTLLFAKLHNIYIILMVVSTIWLGLIGFMDDYIKVFKKDKEGLAGRFKVLGQIGLGLIIGATVYFHPDIQTKVEIPETLLQKVDRTQVTEIVDGDGTKHYMLEKKLPNTTIPFVKDNEFNYSSVMAMISEGMRKYTWVIYILAVIVIVAAVSNGANITDGIDGLATGTSAVIGATLGIFAYISGNLFFADYLNVMFIPFSGELVVFIAAFVGACVGFLWYNSYPAQVFMGDTGSLALGGIIAVFAIVLRKELLIPILCGIFLIENLSVVLQVGYFKYTKKKFGEGRRIFKMSPLHHHYQKLGMHEAKIASRFWIVGILLAIMTIVTLKLR